MTTIADILAAATPVDQGLRMTVPADWMQGRTAYGGLSAAMALHAAMQSAPDLPPLRSAQISFVGPLAGDVTVTHQLLRRGRNAAFIQADVTGEAGLGLRATFVFMRDQASQVDFDAGTATDRRPPEPGDKLWTGPEGFFASNMEFRDLKDPSFGKAELLRWGRMKAHEGLDPFIHLIAMADGMPPAAIRLFDNGFVPLSSLTWIINLLTPSPQTRDGWWLLTARSGFARGGCSSQTMAVWNADGQLVAEGMQSVAIFA
ncbi:thioesterase family protein [Sphingomonas sp.]|uniref:thioesterase family protein n=1 Tax=Sphingomonas sp. TaxID=28214 RepID=UPI001DE3B256|nr:thioesterase family protein [Sphingomonas sp.]MBX9797702.1 thioesterase family protein [Sphingomonas sp.]